MHNILLAIAHGPSSTVDIPQEHHVREAFREEVEEAVESHGGLVMARIEGESWSRGWGSEDATWYSLVVPDRGNTFEATIARILRDVGQDAAYMLRGGSDTEIEALDPDEDL